MTVQPDHPSARIAELEAKLRQAEALAAARDDFIAAISRELINPLAPVLLAVERLRGVLRTGDAARSEAALVLLERAIQGFERRTRLLLSLADMRAGASGRPVAETDLTALLAAAGERHAEVARRAGCAFSVDAAPGLVAAAHAESLSHVLDCLLANAFRFGAGRPVRLRAAPAEAGMLIAVTDQGPGLSPEEAANVFDLFHRPRGQLEPGLGIGLWVAAQLVSSMGGRIWVESKPGQGAHFLVSLAAHARPVIAPPAENLQVRDMPEPRQAN